VPLAVAYDIVLEDHILPHQAVKRAARPFGREVAEMVRYAVGYQSRAFVTFGKPIPLGGYDPESRRDVMDLGHQIRDTIGLLYKVLPTAIVAARDAAVDDERELEGARRRDHRRAAAVERQPRGRRRPRGGRGGAQMLADRNIIHVERGGRYRVRERTVLRYYARTIQHLLVRAAPSERTDAADRLEGFLSRPRRKPAAQTLASRYGMRARGGFARRFIAGETVRRASTGAQIQANACT
jgi:hypothetical protein